MGMGIHQQRTIAPHGHGGQLQLCVHHAIDGIDKGIVNAVNECPAQVDMDSRAAGAAGGSRRLGRC